MAGRDDTDHASASVFIHQSPWQLQMLQRYGSSVCLRRYLSDDSIRDATVPAVCIDKLWIRCRRHLPLNWRAETISAGLRIFAELCPQWSPKYRYFMSDFCKAQIAAAESVFPSTWNYAFHYVCSVMYTLHNLLYIRTVYTILCFNTVVLHYCVNSLLHFSSLSLLVYIILL